MVRPYVARRFLRVGGCAVLRRHRRARLADANDCAKEPLYYTDIAERFCAYDFRTVARALSHLHATEKLWQDPCGRMCVRDSEFRGQAAAAVNKH